MLQKELIVKKHHITTHNGNIIVLKDNFWLKFPFFSLLIYHIPWNKKLDRVSKNVPSLITSSCKKSKHSNLYIAPPQFGACAPYFLWHLISVFAIFCKNFSTQLNKSGNLIQMRYKWVWSRRAKKCESSVLLRWRLTRREPASVRAGSPECRTYRKPGQFDWVPVIDCVFYV